MLSLKSNEEMVEGLRGSYTNAYITTRDGPFGSYHRVRIGPFEARKEAQEVANALVDEGYYIFLDEVAASSILNQRLEMARGHDDRRSREFEPVESSADGLGGVGMRTGMAYHVHSSD